MAMDRNLVILRGHIGHEPKVFSNNSPKVAKFSLATNESRKNPSTGNWESIPTWHQIVAFENIATIVEKHVAKGSYVEIMGKLQNREYNDNGIRKFITEVVATEVHVIMKGKLQNNTSNQDGNYVPDPNRF